MSLNNTKLNKPGIRKGNSKKYYFILSFFLFAVLQSNSLFAGTDPTADFSVDNTTPVVDETVTFTDESTNNGGNNTINTWTWDFGTDAVPPTANTQGPHQVSYSTPGLKTVVLTADKGGDYVDTETKTDYIQVYETYYSTGSGNPASTNSWNTQPDGSGSPPVNTNGDCLNFIIQNGHTMTTTGAWTLGEYSSIQIEDGELNENDEIAIQPTGSLQIDDNGTLNHNVNSLSVFNGTESLSTNSTVNYLYAGDQGVAASSYGNLTLSGGNTKTLQGNASVANDLVIEANTILNTGNNTLTANAALSTASFSMGDGAEFDVEGAFQSDLSYNNISLHDNSTVSYLATGQAVASAPYGNLIIDGGGTIQGDVKVNTSLSLVSGNLSTGAGTNNLTIAADATFTANGGFSATRMIECDGDGSLVKEGNNLSDLEMIYPVGSGGTYSPVEVSSLSGTNSGICSFGVRAIDGIAPNANVTDLLRHWITETANIDNPTATMNFTYDETESQSIVYMPMFSNGTDWFEVATSSQTTTTFTVNDVAYLNGITWSLLESSITTYYSYQSGNWNVASTWTTDPSGSLSENPAVPGSSDRIVILNGRTVTTTEDNYSVISTQINEGGTLNLGTTTGHDFGNVKGEGLLRLSTNNFPAGDFSEFVDAAGGTVEYYNPAANFNFLQYDYNNLILNFDNAGRIARVVGDMNINGDLSIQSGRFQINNNNGGATRTIDILGSVNIETNGRIQLGTGNYNHRFIVKGDFTNNGVVRFTNQATPDYTGTPNNGRVDAIFDNPSADQNIVCNGQTDFYRIEVDKGDIAYVLNIDASATNNFRLFGRNDFVQNVDNPGSITNPNALGLLSGTLRLGENIVLPSIQTEDAYCVDEDASLWLDGSDITFTQTSSEALVLYGNFRSSGNSVFNENSNQGIVSRSTASILIEGGSISTVCVRTSYVAGTHRGAFTMTEGELTIQGDLPTGYGGMNIYAPFILPYTDNTFTMSGGTINILTSSPLAAPGGQFSLILGANPNNISVTGGEININVPDNRNAYFTSTASFWDFNIIASSDNYSAQPRNYGGSASPFIPSINAQPIRVLNNFTLQNSARLTSGTNNVDVLVAGDFTINNGTTYTPGNNTTTLNGDGTQTFFNSGTITAGLNNLTLAGETDLLLDGTATNLRVNGDLTIGSNTILRDNIKTVNVYGDIFNNGTHFRPAGAAGRIELSGGANQVISGDGQGVFNNLAVNKNGGSVSLESNMAINGALRLVSNHRLDINNQLLSFGQNGVVYSSLAGSDQNFTSNKFILTNGLASDEGIKKAFSNTNEFLYPFGFENGGTYYYMPAYIQFNSAPTSWGTVTSRPINERHHLAQGGNNALTTYWKNRTEGFEDIPAGSVTHLYFYDADASNVFVQGDEAQYRPASYRFGTSWDVLPDINLVDQSINQITFSNQNAAHGEYTAGEAPAFGAIPVLYSSGTGDDWNDSNTWSDVGVGEAGGAGTPGPNTIVVIGDETNQHTVTISADNQACGALFIANESMLDLGLTQGHDFAAIPEETVAGGGTLRISSTNYFPSGDFGDFIGPNGGTVEYYATGTDIQIPTVSASGLTINHYRNLILNNQGSTITLPETNLTIFEDLTVEGTSSFSRTFISNGWNLLKVNGDLNINAGELRIRDAAGELITFEISGDLNIASGGIFWVRNGGPDFNHILELYGDLNNQGVFNVQRGGRTITTYFKGIQDTRVAGSGSTYRFYDIIVDKGTDAAPVVSLESEITTGVTNPFLTLLNGTFRVDNPSLTVTLTDGNTNFTIPSTAALSVENGEVRVVYGTGTANLLLSGKLEVLGGSMYIGNPTQNTNNSIEYAAAGTPEINVSGGELFVNGQVRRPTTITSGALNYIQSGGVVTIHGKNRIQNRGLLEITNTNSRFDISGDGILAFDSPSNTGTTFGDIYLRPDIFDITGGTLQTGLELSTAGYDFALGTSCPLWDISVGKSVTPQSLTTVVYEVTILNDLIINSGSQFNANGLDLYIQGNLFNNNLSASAGINDGGFVAGSNTQLTTFKGTGIQEISGSGTNLTNFANLTINTGTKVQLQNNTALRVNRNLTISAGELNDGENIIEVAGNINNTSMHASPSAIGGIRLEGTMNQRLSGVGGVYGNIIMDNTSGVTLLNNQTINGKLTFTKGNIYIDDYLLTFGENASIGGSPGLVNMIILNGALSDQGVRKLFGAGTSSFTMPVGVSGKYTPATYDITSNSDPGSIIVKPVNRRHPAVVEPAETELAYYWSIDSSGFGSDLQISHTYRYLVDDVKPNSSSDNNYVVGLYRTHDYKWEELGDANTPARVNEGSRIIEINNVGFIYGDITAGEADNFTPPLETYYSRNSTGNWYTPGDWLIGSPSGVVATQIPNGNPVVIQGGHTIALDQDGAYSVSVEVIGTLTCGNTVFHNLGTVFGTGKIEITSTSGGFFVFPGGSFDEFFETSGTTVEFMGSNMASLPLKPGNIYKPYQNVIFSGTGQKNMSAENMKVLGNLTIRNGTRLSNTLHNKNLYISGDWINENASTNMFIPGTGTVFFEGSTLQDINVAARETFFNLTMINTGDGAEVFNGNSGIDVTHKLTLTSGVLKSALGKEVRLTNTNASIAITGGSSASHVDGPLSKRIINGQSFTFPVGNNGRLGRMSLTNTSTTSSPAFWTVQYLNNNPNDDGYLTNPENNLDAPLTDVSDNEYWIVDRPVGTSSANISLRWDVNSFPGYTSSSTTRPLLRVVEYEDAATTWTQRGDQVSGTATSGTVSTTIPVNEDDFIFTIGVIGVTAAFDDLSDLEICDNDEIVTIPVNLTGTAPWSLSYRTVGTTTTNFTENNIMTSPYNIQLRGSDIGGDGVYDVELTSISDASVTGVVNTETVQLTVLLTYKPNVSGAVSVGSDETRNYSTTNNGSTYTWSWVGVSGGTIDSPNSFETDITFDQGAGTYVLQVEEESVTGCLATDQISIEVLNVPVPDINPSEPNLCEGITETYSTALNTGNQYRWEVTGGTCNTSNYDSWREGGNTIEVTWNTTGNGSITVEERIGDAGPIGTDTKNFVIYKQPDPFTVSAQDEVICYNTSTNIVVENSENGITYQLQLVLDNSPVGVSVAGNGGAINLSTGTLTANTEFNVLASNLGCENVSSPVEIEVIPGINSYTLTPDISDTAYCEGESGIAIGLDGSDLNVNYNLLAGGTVTGSPVSGTGDSISFGDQTIGNYTIEAVHTLDVTESCTQLMNGNINVSELPVPIVSDQTDSICSEVAGENAEGTIDLTAYETEINNEGNVSYSWYYSDGVTPVVTPTAEVISTTFSGGISMVETYNCVVTNNNTGCEDTATVEITILRVPQTGPQYHISNDFGN